MTIFAVLLVLIALPLWMITIQGGLTQHDSDPAGNAMSRGFAALGSIVLWIVLVVLLLVAAARVDTPSWAGAVWFILPIAAGIAATSTIDFMGKVRGLKWPIILPAVAPAIVLAYAGWCFFPTLQAKTGILRPSLIAWMAMVLLLPIPLLARWRHALVQAAIPQPSPEELARAEAQRAEEQQRQLVESFQGLTSDSSLNDWWRYASMGKGFRQAAMDGARGAKSRQSDVVAMLPSASKAFFVAIPQLDLQVTAEIEQAMRAYLRDQVARLMPYSLDGSITTQVVTEWYQDYFPTIRWLIENHGSCNDELVLLANAVSKYPDCAERQEFLAKLHTMETNRVQE
ncbi:MAG TPA: hypothetical protein VI685_02490 [Candidatus Angelobacter sp.]